MNRIRLGPSVGSRPRPSSRCSRATSVSRKHSGTPSQKSSARIVPSVTSRLRSPKTQPQPGNALEVPIASQHRQIVLERKGRNPRVVGGNGLTRLPEADPEAGIVRGGFLSDRQEFESRQVDPEPLVVGTAKART